MRNRWAEIALHAASPDEGGYTVRDEWGSSSWSEDGMRIAIEQAVIMDRFAESLAMVREIIPLCEHGINVREDDRFSWGINDYIDHWEVSPWFILTGWHDERFCIATMANGLPGGSLWVGEPARGCTP